MFFSFSLKFSNFNFFKAQLSSTNPQPFPVYHPVDHLHSNRFHSSSGIFRHQRRRFPFRFLDDRHLVHVSKMPGHHTGRPFVQRSVLGRIFDGSMRTKESARRGDD